MKYKVKTFPKESIVDAVAQSANPVAIRLRAGKANIIECDSIKILAVNSTGRRLQCEFRLGTESVIRVVYREWVVRAWEKFNIDWPFAE